MYGLDQVHERLTAEQRGRIVNLVPRDERRLHARARVAVAAFATEVEFRAARIAGLSKSRAMARFRGYDDAEWYAQRVAMGSVYYHAVVVFLQPRGGRAAAPQDSPVRGE